MQKAKISLLGTKVECKSCGTLLGAGGQWFGLLVASALGSVFLFVGLYAVSVSSWWPIVAVIMVSVILATIVFYFTGLKRVRRKQLNL